LQTDLEYLRQHYASLSDEALGAMDRAQLVDAARQCYDLEVAQRKATMRQNTEWKPSALPQEEPGWREDAACVGSFVESSGNDAGPAAEEAGSVLRAAGIPCFIAKQETPPEPASPQKLEYRVMVPGALNLRALSVLDKEIYNPQLEADWRAHFGELSNEELRGLNPDVICAGMQDRMERLKKAWEEEMARRSGR